MNPKMKKLMKKKNYHNHIKKIHKFIEQFNVKDKNGLLIQSGYEYFSELQKEIISKYENLSYLKEIIGVDKWTQYQELMKMEMELREE